MSNQSIVKEQWIDEFMERLWEHHTCDWKEGNSIPYYPLQLAVAHFDWGDWENSEPERTVDEAFSHYLIGENIDYR